MYVTVCKLESHNHKGKLPWDNAANQMKYYYYTRKEILLPAFGPGQNNQRTLFPAGIFPGGMSITCKQTRLWGSSSWQPTGRTQCLAVDPDPERFGNPPPCFFPCCFGGAAGGLGGILFGECQELPTMLTWLGSPRDISFLACHPHLPGRNN